VMMPRSRANAALVQSALRALSLYPPARDYIMQMKYKPRPYFREGLMSGDASGPLRGRMFAQPLVERTDGTKTLLDDVLGKDFAIVEWDDGRHPLAPCRDDRPLKARVVRVIPRDHRPVARDAGIDQVRDVAGSVARLFDQSEVRGVILRPDRYVAACLARTSSAHEADRVLEQLVRLTNVTTEARQASLLLDLAMLNQEI
jgi:3-(3-hydroxy-phenyl)propionate hydroxylase